MPGLYLEWIHLQKDQEEDLLDRMAHHGERYLKGVVASIRETHYDVTYALAVGDIRTTTSKTNYKAVVTACSSWATRTK